MKIQYPIYCRLEHFCLHELIKDKQIKKTKSIFHYDENDPDVPDYAVDVYLEEYNNFESAKARIVELNQIWRKANPEKERFWTEEERKLCFVQEIIDSNVNDECLSVILYNRWNDHIVVGISCLGWIIPGFTRYTQEYIDNYNRKQNIFFEKDKTFVFYMPERTEFLYDEFVSEKTARSLIKEWLDTGQYRKYLTNHVDKLVTEEYINLPEL